MSRDVPTSPHSPAEDSWPASRAHSTQRRWRWVFGRPMRCSGAILAMVVGLVAVGEPASASAIDWLRPRRPKAAGERAAGEPRASQERNALGGRESGDLPGIFASETPADVNGKGLSIGQFVQSHWQSSNKRFETSARALARQLNDKRCATLIGRLYSLDMQLYKESLRLGSRGVAALRDGTRQTASVLEDLNRIITAPREETLANLEQTIARVHEANGQQQSLVRSHIVGTENIVTMTGEAYQTLELMPSLGIPPLDGMMLASKQAMKQIKSGAEALKGFLLNVQAGTEQVAAGLELMISTLKSTLKYSDHFAFRQYPLVNLPVPAREKLFSQVSALRNVVQGVGNTVSIADSHVRNAAQQMTHLVTGAGEKIDDGCRYQKAVDFSSGNLPQIILYSVNQVTGLGQRVKEGVLNMQAGMARVARPSAGSARTTAPGIALETPDQAQARRTAAAVDPRLPLFLLGGRPQRELPPSQPLEAPASVLESPDGEWNSGGADPRGPAMAGSRSSRSEAPRIQASRQPPARSAAGSKRPAASRDFGAEAEEGRGLPTGFMSEEMQVLARELGTPLSSFVPYEEGGGAGDGLFSALIGADQDSARDSRFADEEPAPETDRLRSARAPGFGPPDVGTELLRMDAVRPPAPDDDLSLFRFADEDAMAGGASLDESF
jgi:hypothetical protein